MADETKCIQKSKAYQDLDKTMEHTLALRAAGVSVAEMKAYLNTLDDNDMLLMAQDGYYADGKYADIYTYGETIEDGGIKYYVIGHSPQQY